MAAHHQPLKQQLLRSLRAEGIEPRVVRSLADVLADVTEARRAFNASWYTDRECECLDRLGALQDEARELIEAATGVSWQLIADAAL